jgi:TolB-like protein
VAFGPFRLDPRGRRLTQAGIEVPLGRRAFDVLCALAAAGGEAVSKDTLLDQVWPGLTVEENNLQVQISALRKALDDGMIATIPGRGCRLTMVPSGGRSPSDATAGKPSIAVLPFTNMSDDIEQEYFADGVADDIITELARVRPLFVIARNSSFAYKGRVVDVRQIASELGVRYILEGSIRRGAGRLRINAQLIDANAAPTTRRET